MENMFFSIEQILNTTSHPMARTGCCKANLYKWKVKPTADKTEEHFKKHITEAYHELKNGGGATSMG
eukprot:13765020-Ditylum_brightwellii.AAC.1